MDRREFFRLTAGAGVALLLPEFAVPEVAAKSERVPITLTFLHENYYSLCYGFQHPTRIVMSPIRYEEVLLKIGAHRFPPLMLDGKLRFADAWLYGDGLVHDDL